MCLILYWLIAAYNMVACRMGDTRNGGGVSQVPLKRWIFHSLFTLILSFLFGFTRWSKILYNISWYETMLLRIPERDSVERFFLPFFIQQIDWSDRRAWKRFECCRTFRNTFVFLIIFWSIHQPGSQLNPLVGNFLSMSHELVGFSRNSLSILNDWPSKFITCS